MRVLSGRGAPVELSFGLFKDLLTSVVIILRRFVQITNEQTLRRFDRFEGVVWERSSC